MRPPAVPGMLALWLVLLFGVVFMDGSMWSEMSQGIIYAATYFPFYVLYLMTFMMEVLFIDEAHSIYMRFLALNERLDQALTLPSYQGTVLHDGLLTAARHPCAGCPFAAKHRPAPRDLLTVLFCLQLPPSSCTWAPWTAAGPAARRGATRCPSTRWLTARCTRRKPPTVSPGFKYQAIFFLFDFL